MRIKEQHKPIGLFGFVRNFLRKRSKLKWLLLFPLLLMTIAGSLALGILYGAKLQVEGKVHYAKRWGSTTIKKPFTLVSNFIDGMKADPDVMVIDIKAENKTKLAFQRDLALTYGPAYRVHPANMGYVPASLTYNDQKVDIKIKLKGGQVEHFGHPFKWSFKMKTRGGEKIDGMKFFSVQQAKNRVYINEWILHQFLAYNDLIALNYKFVHLKVNGDDYGVYSLEENMGKQLIERNGRKEGPIINYSSDLRWDYTAGQAHQFYGSNINNYTEKDMLENVKLQKDFEIARSLMESFRIGTLPTKKVFDLQKLATFFAIIDLTGNQHATTLNNMKFYFNPITSLIEPIGYDNGYFNRLPSEPLYGERIQMKLDSTTVITKNNWETPWYEALFTDKEFVQAYVSALERISEKDFLDQFFESIQEDFDKNVQILRSDHPWYNHDGEFENPDNLYHNQNYIRKFLAPGKALQVYYDSLKSNTRTIQIQASNIYSFPIEVTGLTYRTIEDSLTFSSTLQQPVILQPYQGKAAEFVDIEMPVPAGLTWENIKLDSVMQFVKLDYRVYGTQGKLDDVVYPFIPRTENFENINLMRQEPNIEDFDFLQVNEAAKIITIKEGEWNINKNMIIPAGYKVVGGGRSPINLDLTNNALILSYSPLILSGAEESPINFYSSDTTAQGIIVMKAKERSKMEYVNFNNMGRPNKGNYALTGAVTFFESPVDINTCIFHYNRIGDDYLNTVRTDFTMANTTFTAVNADAFDADFCTGKINDTRFIGVGNDGIDVSGTYLEINNVFMDKIFDKALSAGEDSKMIIRGAIINRTELGVTSKDKSSVNISNVTMDSTKVAYIAFVKKPEYGPASITVNNSELKNCKEPYMIEKSSRLFVNGQRTTSKIDKDIESRLYGAEFGAASGPR